MISLKNLHTFHCEVDARSVIDISNVQQLQLLYEEGFFKKKPWMFLGGGSNVLFLKNYEGTILLNMLKGRTILTESTESHLTMLNIASGELWHDTVLWTLKHNLNGIENLSLIPGTMGAAPMQNIGAYGVELKEVFHSLQAFDVKTGELKTFFKDECRFGYRDSIFKNKYKDQLIILSVQLQLRNDGITNIQYGDLLKTLNENGSQESFTPAQVSEAVISIRQSKLPDPDEIGNAGSFFKNPVVTLAQFNKLKMDFEEIPGYKTGDNERKVPAGWLIEQCGFKGKRIGDTGCHVKQALVLVNYGEASGEEIMELAKTIQLAVSEKFDIHLIPEVNVIG